jgi:hypothetical protein
MYLGAANRTGKERFMGNQLILVVQIQHHKLFPLQPAIFSFSQSRAAWVEVNATPVSAVSVKQVKARSSRVHSVLGEEIPARDE